MEHTIMSTLPVRSQKMEALGMRAGGIAHDFNSMLAPIMGYGELAQQCVGEGSPLRRYLDNIMLAASRARELADRILAFSRTGLTHRTPVVIQRVVAEALELLKVSLPPHVRLEQELSASNTRVIGDPTQLHRVITNLCSNAGHAMPKGGVLHARLEPQRVSTSCACSRGELSVGAYVCLTIRDSGTGIAPEILERMFDPFFTTKAVDEGTGLGLWLVDEIVAEFDGAIDVSSTLGVGTTFKVWLPVAAESTRPVTSTQSASDVTTPRRSSPSRTVTTRTSADSPQVRGQTSRVCAKCPITQGKSPGQPTTTSTTFRRTVNAPLDRYLYERCREDIRAVFHNNPAHFQRMLEKLDQIDPETLNDADHEELVKLADGLVLIRQTHSYA
jgi:hypothetical protein